MREVRSSRRSASESQSSRPSSRRLTEQELEIARLREESCRRDEYYARVLEQQQGMIQVSILHYYCLFIALHIPCAILTYLVNSY